MGSKAFNLMRMAAAGLDIPPAIVVDIRTCADFFAADETLPTGFDQQFDEALRWLERISGRRFGDLRRPLLGWYRSGRARQCPCRG
jgi:pyruvate,orthophosphate dikinase